MNDGVRQQLCDLIATYGRSLCDDPRRCEGLLRDFCGESRREIHVLVGALKARVAADLLASQSGVPRAALFARLTKRLQDDLGLAEDAARWAVESWASALGVRSNAEHGARGTTSTKATSHRQKTDPPVSMDLAAAPASRPARSAPTGIVGFLFFGLLLVSIALSGLGMLIAWEEVPSDPGGMAACVWILAALLLSTSLVVLCPKVHSLLFLCSFLAIFLSGAFIVWRDEYLLKTYSGAPYWAILAFVAGPAGIFGVLLGFAISKYLIKGADAARLSR